MIESKEAAGAALERVGQLQQQVDSGEVDPAGAAPEIVDKLNSVIGFFVMAGATENLYTAIVEPLAKWNIYSVSLKFLENPDAPGAQSARQLFDALSAFCRKWETLDRA
ncbi:hypothetical protein [Winogradskya humida]|uniref:Uncharacterized protein n=1 Tax=Winogradskya humida TaxID=113566 RepID=A0ABQ4A178_9ACTN|nr:hypothetical protein [Actinoplanes humidus]GIE24610.1 hypothetical protein Ahu01nite_077120 [Actinoplanes humidus]